MRVTFLAHDGFFIELDQVCLLFDWWKGVLPPLPDKPLLVFVSVGALNLLYQFWVHTRHIPKLGWFEWFFVTPSNHRAHHAQNALYMDRSTAVCCLYDLLYGGDLKRKENGYGSRFLFNTGQF